MSVTRALVSDPWSQTSVTHSKCVALDYRVAGFSKTLLAFSLAARLVERASNLNAFKTLNLVANLHIAVVLDTDTAFGAGANFIHVVFKAA